VKDIFALGDALGPAKVIFVQQPALGLQGVLVVDNVATGPAIGGLRMAADVSAEECARLARAMTLKNAAAGLPHGGGKSVLVGDPKMTRAKKERLIRGFAYALRNEQDYIFGPDMGTDEDCMAWVKDEIGRSVGLPCEIGGIPLDRIGATGWGLSHAVDIAIRHCDFDLQGARVVVQGFGAVGRHAARFLAAQGAVLVGAADSQGTVYDPDGLSVESLTALKQESRSVIDYPGGAKLDREAVIDLECEIWVPAARPDVLHADNVKRLKARLVVQGANIPCTYGAEKYLHEQGVLCIPDFIANAGGVICAAMEYHGSSQTHSFETIEEKVRENTRLVLDEAVQEGIMPRDAAIRLAERRVLKAMDCKRWSIY